MSVILCVETSTPVCSVALAEGNTIISQEKSNTNMSHASLLGGYVDNMLQKAKDLGKTIDAVCVSMGPGSYTGLRIGVSMAKGICMGLGVPLLAADTLRIIAEGAMKATAITDTDLVCPMIDARRMEVYSALYNIKGEMCREVLSEIITEQSFATELSDQRIIFCGNGSDKCESVITNPNAVFLKGIEPLAENMASIAATLFNQQDFKDVAYFEPFYLKEFVATVAKNKVL